MAWIDFAIVWLVALVLSAIFVWARVAEWLWGRYAPDPPDDPAALVHWRRRRLWIVLSEASALPAYPSFAQVMVISLERPIWWTLPFAMALSSLGFMLFRGAVQDWARRLLGLPKFEGQHDD